MKNLWFGALVLALAALPAGATVKNKQKECKKQEV